MERKTAAIVGAAAALAVTPALAAPVVAPPVPPASSYAELLQPIPNAVERLKAADAQAEAKPAGLIDVQYHHHHNNYNAHHHHNNYNSHHHHNRWWYRHNGYMWFGGNWVTGDYYRAHHHHHHHHSY